MDSPATGRVALDRAEELGGACQRPPSPHPPAIGGVAGVLALPERGVARERERNGQPRADSVDDGHTLIAGLDLDARGRWRRGWPSSRGSGHRRWSRAPPSGWGQAATLMPSRAAASVARRRLATSESRRSNNETSGGVCSSTISRMSSAAKAPCGRTSAARGTTPPVSGSMRRGSSSTPTRRVGMARVCPSFLRSTPQPTPLDADGKTRVWVAGVTPGRRGPPPAGREPSPARPRR